MAFNAKYDLQCLTAAGIITSYQYPASSLCDPMVAENLLEENHHPGEMSLEAICDRRFGHKKRKFMDAWRFGPNSKEFEGYAVDDVVWELKLWQFLKPLLEQNGLMQIFKKVLMPAACTIADMEMVGIKWDLTQARRLLRGFQVLRDTLEKEVYKEIGHLNIASGDQVAKRLFDELGYSTRGIKTTASGKRLEVGEKAMELLAKKYAVCDKILGYRTAAKMVTTYVLPCTNWALADKERRIHGTFWLISTTGRIRGDKPNLQNIPSYVHKKEGFAGLKIKDAFIPRDGFAFLCLDYSQLELRILAHVVQEPKFLKAYLTWGCTKCRKTGISAVILHRCPECGCEENEKALVGEKDCFWHGEDIHKQTTDKIKIFKGDRQLGKKLNFEAIYNAGGWKLNQVHPELSIDEWDEALEEFFGPNGYPTIRRWHLYMEQQMKATRVCRDIFGRRRVIPKADLAKGYKHALNQFINFPIQAGACNLGLLCFSNIRKRCMELGVWLREIFPTNWVHDEILMEVVTKKATEYAILVRDIMETSVQLKVPIRADWKIVKNWGDAK